jgi:hypothetical protein
MVRLLSALCWGDRFAGGGGDPGAELEVVSSVGHYDFLADCTPAGQAAVPLRKVGVPQPQTHNRAICRAHIFRRPAGRAANGGTQANPAR